jgi:hypothetical protein
MVYQLKSAVEDGLLEVLDDELLLEMRHFSLVDLDVTERPENITRHFDLLTACAIAWKMKDYARVAKTKHPYQQPAYEPVSAYETPNINPSIGEQRRFAIDDPQNPLRVLREDF